MAFYNIKKSVVIYAYQVNNNKLSQGVSQLIVQPTDQ